MNKDDLIKKVLTIIRKHLSDDYHIVLFGSWAKDDALETSDIDIGIVGETEAPWNIMVKIRQEVDDIRTLRKIDVVDLNAVDDRFKNNVLRYAKPLSL